MFPQYLWTSLEDKGQSTVVSDHYIETQFWINSVLGRGKLSSGNRELSSGELIRANAGSRDQSVAYAGN